MTYHKDARMTVYQRRRIRKRVRVQVARPSEAHRRPHDQRCICLPSRRSHIQHSLTEASHAWTNGLIERTGGTIKLETVYRWQFASTAMLDATLLRAYPKTS